MKRVFSAVRTLIMIFTVMAIIAGIFGIIHSQTTWTALTNILAIVLWGGIGSLTLFFHMRADQGDEKKPLRPVAIVFLTLAFVVIGVILLSGVVSLLSHGTQATKSVEPPTIARLLQLVNEERTKVNVAPLAIDSRLNESAQYKAEDMFKRNYFGHEDPKTGKHGYDIAFERTGEMCSFVSENITDNVIDADNTSEQTIFNWVNSPSHYNAMIDSRYTYTGFGIAGTKIVQHFCQVN